MTGKQKIKPKTKKAIKVAGDDLKALLYNFLEEFLYLLDTDSFLVSEVKKIKITEKAGKHFLEAEAAGDKAQNYETHGDVKAVTYNEMEVKQKKPIHVQVVVDI